MKANRDAGLPAWPREVQRADGLFEGEWSLRFVAPPPLHQVERAVASVPTDDLSLVIEAVDERQFILRAISRHHIGDHTNTVSIVRALWAIQANAAELEQINSQPPEAWSPQRWGILL